MTNWRNDLKKVLKMAGAEYKQVSYKEPFNSLILSRIFFFILHSLLVNKVTCRENKVGEKGGKGFGCPSKKEEECMLLFWGGQQAGQA